MHQTKEVERSTSTNQTQVTPHQTVGKADKIFVRVSSSTFSKTFRYANRVSLQHVSNKKNEQVACEYLDILLRTPSFLDSETDPRSAPNLADDKSDGTFLRVADMCPFAS